MRQIIKATNDTICQIVKQEIENYGDKADLNHIDVSGVTNMSYLFYESTFDGDISKWDVSNVWDMSNMFAFSQFTGKNGDISGWDVSNVTDMSEMFLLSQFDGDLSKWNVDPSGTIKNIFRRCPGERRARSYVWCGIIRLIHPYQ